MKTTLMLTILLAITSMSSSFAKDYKKDEIIKQEMGTFAETQSKAVTELMMSCLSVPFIEKNLAELVGLNKITYSIVNDEVMAYGECTYKIRFDLTESK